MRVIMCLYSLHNNVNLSFRDIKFDNHCKLELAV